MLDPGVSEDRLQESFPQPYAAVGFEDEQVANLGEGDSVGDEAGKPDLTVIRPVETETERMFDRRLDDLPWSASCPEDGP